MDPLQLITLGGAAGMAVWVLNLLASGKFHTHSEVEGLRADKAELFAANKILADANAQVTPLLKEILEADIASAMPKLDEILALLREEDTG